MKRHREQPFDPSWSHGMVRPDSGQERPTSSRFESPGSHRQPFLFGQQFPPISSHTPALMPLPRAFDPSPSYQRRSALPSNGTQVDRSGPFAFEPPAPTQLTGSRAEAYRRLFAPDEPSSPSPAAVAPAEASNSALERFRYSKKQVQTPEQHEQLHVCAPQPLARPVQDDPLPVAPQPGSY